MKNSRLRRITAILTGISIISASSCGVTVEQAKMPSEQIETVSKDDTSSETQPVTDAENETKTISDEAAEEAAETQTTSAETTTATETTTTVTEEKIMRGNLYDSDGDVLMFSSIDKNGKEVRMTNDDNKIAFANVLNEMSEGLDLTLNDILRTENSVPVENGDYGQSVQLTFDADVQNAVYDYMAAKGINGAAVVMRSDGSLMAQVSYPSYDPDYYFGIETEEDLAWGTYGNKAFQNFPPGSCFKIMSEVISDKHGVYSLQDEGEWFYDGVSIVNWDHDRNYSYPMERSLNSAFVNSSNIFFARSFDQIGKEDVLDDLDTIFHFVTPIDCDFGTMKNNIEIYCNDDLRRSAFGQSYVMTCPIYLAALGREAAYGEMVKPFVVKNIVDTTDFYNVIKEGSQPDEVIASIPQEYRQNLLDGMSGVARGLGISVPEGYEFYAKTGTAETWEGDFLYITGILKNTSDDGNGVYTDYNDYNGSYIVVIQIRNPASFGYSFASESAPLYQGLVNAVLNN